MSILYIFFLWVTAKIYTFWGQELFFLLISRCLTLSLVLWEKRSFTTIPLCPSGSLLPNSLPASQKSKGRGDPADLFPLNTCQWQATIISHGALSMGHMKKEFMTSSWTSTVPIPLPLVPWGWVVKWTECPFDKLCHLSPQSHLPRLISIFNLKLTAFIPTQCWGTGCHWSI